MAMDRRRLLTGLRRQRISIWTEARSKFAELANKETPAGFDEHDQRAPGSERRSRSISGRWPTKPRSR